MKKIAFGVLITSLIVFALCFLFVLVGIIEIEEPRRIINVFLVLFRDSRCRWVCPRGKWLYDEKLNPVDRAYATLVDMRVEKQMLFCFLLNLGCLNWKITGKLN